MGKNHIRVLSAIGSIPATERNYLKIVRICARTGLSPRHVKRLINSLRDEQHIKAERPKLGLAYSIEILPAGQKALENAKPYERIS